ncbi:hypothetical protein ABFY41_11320 [Acinetobacter haemolyticus]|uniref:hypothetical protein n=1 Tax=Acinetobacter haemolyticus TaxID=29430 RepID=UPI00148F92F7|nr:hypothetical protein [Acinetobacter haemolyticus]
MAAKLVSIPEAQLIQWFGSQVQMLTNNGTNIENLTLSYNRTDGYAILLQEVGNTDPDE